MSQSQSASIQPHSINPSEYERAIAQTARKEHDGQWSCKQCGKKFNSTVGLVTHILTFCDDPLSTFATESAIRVCMLLDPSGSQEMLESYLRVANEEADEESSDHDSDMETEEAGDSEGEESGSDATSSEEDGEDDELEEEGAGDSEGEESGSDATSSEEDGEDEELVEEGEASTEPWWIEEEGQGEEEGDDLESADEDDESSDLTDDEAYLPAQHVGRPPSNQAFPAAPPHSLSADEKREWTFRRDRKYQDTLLSLPPPHPQFNKKKEK